MELFGKDKRFHNLKKSSLIALDVFGSEERTDLHFNVFKKITYIFDRFERLLTECKNIEDNFFKNIIVDSNRLNFSNLDDNELESYNKFKSSYKKTIINIINLRKMNLKMIDSDKEFFLQFQKKYFDPMDSSFFYDD